MNRPFRPSRALPSHLTGIDAIRGVAALCVVVFHYQHFYLADAYARPSLPPTSTYPYAAAFDFLYRHGHYAVQIFWVISGFVFAHVYLRRPTTLRQFAGARIARLYPLHFVTLLFVAVVEFLSLHLAGHLQIYGNFTISQFVLQLFMASNWTTLTRGLSFNGPIWSVSLEIFAYGVFFVALPLLRCWPLAVGALLCAGGFAIGGLKGVHIHFIAIASFTTAGYFFAGFLLYLFARRTWHALPRLIAGVLALTGAAVVVHLLSLRTDFSLALAASAIVLVGICAERLPLAELRPLQFLGDLSYSIYLVHVPIQMTLLFVADEFFAGTRAFANSYLTLPLFLIATLVVASLAHYRFERPAGRFLRRRFRIATPNQNAAP